MTNHDTPSFVNPFCESRYCWRFGMRFRGPCNRPSGKPEEKPEEDEKKEKKEADVVYKMEKGVTMKGYKEHYEKKIKELGEKLRKRKLTEVDAKNLNKYETWYKEKVIPWMEERYETERIKITEFDRVMAGVEEIIGRLDKMLEDKAPEEMGHERYETEMQKHFSAMITESGEVVGRPFTKDGKVNSYVVDVPSSWRTIYSSGDAINLKPDEEAEFSRDVPAGRDRVYVNPVDAPTFQAYDENNEMVTFTGEKQPGGTILFKVEKEDETAELVIETVEQAKKATEEAVDEVRETLNKHTEDPEESPEIYKEVVNGVNDTVEQARQAGEEPFDEARVTVVKDQMEDPLLLGTDSPPQQLSKSEFDQAVRDLVIERVDDPEAGQKEGRHTYGLEKRDERVEAMVDEKVKDLPERVVTMLDQQLQEAVGRIDEDEHQKPYRIMDATQQVDALEYHRASWGLNLPIDRAGNTFRSELAEQRGQLNAKHMELTGRSIDQTSEYGCMCIVRNNVMKARIGAEKKFEGERNSENAKTVVEAIDAELFVLREFRVNMKTRNDKGEVVTTMRDTLLEKKAKYEKEYSDLGGKVEDAKKEPSGFWKWWTRPRSESKWF